MGLDSFGKRAKNAIRAAVLGGATIAGAAAAESALKANDAEAQTITQQSRGNNSPNIISGGNVIFNGSGEIGKPNISTRTEGNIHQRSERDNSPNIITNDNVTINGKVYFKKK